MNYRRTYDVTAFSPLRQINRTTVRQLRPVWSYSMRDNRRWLPTPLVANGLMYVPEGSGRVVAFDAVSGDVVWIHERKYPEDVSMSEAFPRHRGVSILGNTLYWGTADSYLVALDAQTGKLLWEVQTGDYHLGEGHNHPPLIAEGKVFLGHAGGDLGARGKFRAFDAQTGRLLWTVYTAPGPGDPGYETWTHRDVPPLGGAPWNTVSYDPELRLVYFSTGQPAPWSTAVRGPGDALYTNSVVAVDPQTGTIRWHFQLNPADDWDRAAYENMLVDLVIDGRTRKALIQTGKIGWGVVLDRQTGEFLHAFKTAYDNVITEWTPQGRPVINPGSVPTPADVDSGKVFEICPHLHGARNLQAPSYSPLTRLYYLGVNNSCMDAKVVSTKYVPGRSYTGVTYTPKRAPGYDHVGEFVAFDPLTGRRAWTYRQSERRCDDRFGIGDRGRSRLWRHCRPPVLCAEFRYGRPPLANALERRHLRSTHHVRDCRETVRRGWRRGPNRTDDIVCPADGHRHSAGFGCDVGVCRANGAGQSGQSSDVSPPRDHVDVRCPGTSVRLERSQCSRGSRERRGPSGGTTRACWTVCVQRCVLERSGHSRRTAVQPGLRELSQN